MALGVAVIPVERLAQDLVIVKPYHVTLVGDDNRECANSV